VRAFEAKEVCVHFVSLLYRGNCKSAHLLTILKRIKKKIKKKNFA
jgi:hypothetical protein